MKALTPFQNALLTATESQFDDVPEEDQIHILPSQEFYNSVPGKRKSLTPLRKVILIAASLSLLVAAVVASQSFSLGKVEVEKYIFPVEAGDDVCDVYDIVFYDEIANEDAPKSIQTFYFPTKDVSVENANWVRVSENVQTFQSFQRIPDDLDDSQYDWYLDHFPENPTRVSAEWYIDGQQMMFSQNLAYDVPVGEKYWSIAYPPEVHAVMQAEVLEISNFEVLSVEVESDIPFQEGRETFYYWYWTNGDYVFQLIAENVDKEYMQQLMESVQPVEDTSPYLGEG